MIPKGMVELGETPVQAALREFEEEVGVRLEMEPVPLCRVRQAGGKIVETFAAEGDLDVSTIKSTHFGLEWPPRSGSLQSYPEVAQGRWMRMDEARRLILPSQKPVLDALAGKLAA
jgi:predicted NUDIX family NTP pyrophosphohydrolase